MPSDSSSDSQSIIRDSTLRLSGKTNYGTGFFIAPGLVLTCNHVVKSYDDQIKAVWNGQEFSVDVIQAFEDQDIALLGINVIDHPCVFLDQQEACAGQTLYAYGYPKSDKDGFSISGLMEGPSDQGRLLTFKDANVRDGFSGSPLLNVETKKVCGMITHRRDRTHPSQAGKQILEPIGGHAIPAGVVMRRWPELLSHTSVIEVIFNLKAISQLGIFADSFNQDQDQPAINPWKSHQELSLPPSKDLKSVILAWAKRMHFSFSNVETSQIEDFINRLNLSNIGIQEEDCIKYFSIPESDMRFTIMKNFSSLSYKRVAPFDDCIYFFLFLSTNNHSFLDMVNAELIRQKFIDFSKDSVHDRISRMYR